MRLLRNDSKSAELTLTLDELLTLHQSLNEVCNGIEIFEFETRMGVSEEEASSLMDAIREVIFKIRTYKEYESM